MRDDQQRDTKYSIDDDGEKELSNACVQNSKPSAKIHFSRPRIARTYKILLRSKYQILKTKLTTVVRGNYMLTLESSNNNKKILSYQYLNQYLI